MGRGGVNRNAEGAVMKQVIHVVDWTAAIVLAIALTPYLPGAIKIYNVTGNLWAYTVVVIMALAWAFGRVLFKRLNSVA